jgi:hypothetical protein
MIQRDQLESRYAGRAAFVERLLGVFVHTYAAVPGELRQAVESGNLQKRHWLERRNRPPARCDRKAWGWPSIWQMPWT